MKVLMQKFPRSSRLSRKAGYFFILEAAACLMKL